MVEQEEEASFSFFPHYFFPFNRRKAGKKRANPGEITGAEASLVPKY
jgi:hypothetical protein